MTIFLTPSYTLIFEIPASFYTRKAYKGNHFGRSLTEMQHAK